METDTEHVPNELDNSDSPTTEKILDQSIESEEPYSDIPATAKSTDTNTVESNIIETAEADNVNESTESAEHVVDNPGQSSVLVDEPTLPRSEMTTKVDDDKSEPNQLDMNPSELNKEEDTLLEINAENDSLADENVHSSKSNTDEEQYENAPSANVENTKQSSESVAEADSLGETSSVLIDHDSSSVTEALEPMDVDEIQETLNKSSEESKVNLESVQTDTVIRENSSESTVAVNQVHVEKEITQSVSEVERTIVTPSPTMEGEKVTAHEEKHVQSDDKAGVMDVDVDPDSQLSSSENTQSAVEPTTTSVYESATEPDELDRPEQVNMETVDETADKEKTGAEDPFDSVKQNVSNSSNTGEKYNIDMDETLVADDSEKLNDTSEEAVVEVDGVVDDLERGKGVDEALSLLPDADRELSDADKERAVQVEAATSKDAVSPEEYDEAIDETTPENVENNLNNSLNSSEVDNASDTPNSPEEALLKEGEIRELSGNPIKSTCCQCKESLECLFTKLQAGEVGFICTSSCLKVFQDTHPDFKLLLKPISIITVADAKKSCAQCSEEKICKFLIKHPDAEAQFLCEDSCLDALLERNPDMYIVKRKRYTIEEMAECTEDFTCMQCTETKKCRFSFQQEDDVFHICSETCLNLLMKEQPDRFRIKRRSVRVRDLPKRAGSGSATISAPDGSTSSASEVIKMLARTEAEAETARLDREQSFIRRCAKCFLPVTPSERTLHWETYDFCNETCLGQYQNLTGANCTTCNGDVQLTSLGKYCVRFGYEIRQFCRSACLDNYKKGLKVCSFCQKDISKDDNGFLAAVGAGQFKDFCTPMCMRKYDEICNSKKKTTTATCSVCMNEDQVGVEVLINGNTHSFCSNPCFSAFQFVNNINTDKCDMCSKYFERRSVDPYTIYPMGAKPTPLMYCSKVCMNVFIITHRKIVPCQWCKVKKYNFDMIQRSSSGKTPAVMLCSLNCLTLCDVSMNAISMKKKSCDQCRSMTAPQYHLTMSDASLRNFCTYQCVMAFQSQFSRTPLTLDGQKTQSSKNTPVPTGLPKRIKATAASGQQGQANANTTPNSSPNASTIAATTANQSSKAKYIVKNQIKPVSLKQLSKTPPKPMQSSTNKVPIISNVTSLATGATTRNRKSIQPMGQTPAAVDHESGSSIVRRTGNTYTRKSMSAAVAPPIPFTEPAPRAVTPPQSKVKAQTHIVTIPPLPKRVSNMTTMCKPAVETRDTQAGPETASIACQTDSCLERTIFIPIPVPIYVPQPMHMYSLPTPIPVPFPLPIPVPIFIPTTRNSANGIMKEIKKIQDKMPTDPYEAELLMMAEMVAGDKKKSDSDSGSEDEASPDDDFVPETINDGVGLGEDMLQMALKMAQDYEEPAVDLESAMTANTITSTAHPHLQYEGDLDDPTAIQQHHQMMVIEQQRLAAAARGGAGAARKRALGGAGTPVRNARTASNATPPAKRVRRQEMALISPPQPEPPREPVEKADANMCLKFTFGVNAWKQWVMTKNADLEKSSIRRKPFKSELLQLTADELNYSLCLFVKEVRKPNGSEYAPDTIYYLVLGIQQYLYENGRIDNIFTDPYYEKFTDCLDDVAKKFSVLYNDSQYIVTRVEEEHLWECKQLGAHSPHVLLSTLMFFNTKHFNLTTVEEHMQLSFSHIMKHWKRNPNQVGAAKTPGSRNVLLRFYPPQATLESNSRKKKVYEQQENEENPLRCPVKLYEFYLSKCPESVKTRNDVFYLQPERSCVPDSPVWYSTQALGKESLCKMLHRVKMVKEINIALLTS